MKHILSKIKHVFTVLFLPVPTMGDIYKMIENSDLTEEQRDELREMATREHYALLNGTTYEYE